MEKITFELPFLFGDHHVLEVRKLLNALPGVTNIYVSSSFHTVDVDYDPAAINVEQITAGLEEAGYLGEAEMPVEKGVTSEGGMNTPYFRRTNIYENTKQVTSFTQNIGFSQRRVWPCPGMGAIISVKLK